VENHSGSDVRGGGVGKGHWHSWGHRRGDSSSSGSSNKPIGDECRCCGKMGHWACEYRSKSKKEQAHVVQDEVEGSLLLVTTTLMHPKARSTPKSVVEAISSVAEIELKEDRVYTHLDEEKERDAGIWVLDTRATNHMSGCRVAFTKLDTVVLGTMRFGNDSVARIEGHGTIMFMCKNGESQSLEGVYFIPRLATNIVSIGQLDEVGYKIDIDTGVMKIRDPRGLLLARVKCEADHLYLVHINLGQPVCFAVCGRGDEVAWHWHKGFRHINMVALQKLARR
jgi:hypothetical protein